VRFLLIGAVLGALLGGCSFVMLGTVSWLPEPQRVGLSLVIGLSFAALLWSYAAVRLIARRVRSRGSPAESTDGFFGADTAPIGEPTARIDLEGGGPERVNHSPKSALAFEETGTIIAPGFLEVLDDSSPPPTVSERPDLDDSPKMPFDPIFADHDDECATQIVSRDELKALARAMLEETTATVAVPAERLAPHEVDDLLNDAHRAVEHGRFEEALAAFSRVLGDGPDARAYLGRGRIYLDHHDFNEAMNDFALAEELMPGAPEPLVAMGDLCFAAKDYVQSIEYLTLALKQQPNNAMALTRRGMSLYYRKQFEMALDDLQRAARLDPDIPMLGSYLVRAERRVRGVPATVQQDRRRRISPRGR